MKIVNNDSIITKDNSTSDNFINYVVLQEKEELKKLLFEKR